MLASAVCYSVFVLLPFAKLVVADVVLYAVALLMELASLIALRRKEPELRGVFRLPFGARGVTALAALPAIVLIALVWLSLADGDSALPAVIGSIVAIVLGVPLYRWRASVPGTAEIR